MGFFGKGSIRFPIWDLWHIYLYENKEISSENAGASKLNISAYYALGLKGFEPILYSY